ncbi:hypothetical protein BDM02DRAFT_3106644 [Thelephora ganbajun]|uniref:Uncharacterized protein n=1 Tax=Thelephora ganbajun TaxID=370292 RepID=A0ACB6ZXB8_THEGA|nr:hypothetical protein BDM02DRAFT_3106644 [Thelephora ganbajun]
MAFGELPYYIFISNSSLLSTAQVAPSSLLLHPSIQYHYQDDSPLDLLPRSEDEHVLVLDYDPMGFSQPSAKSISNNIAVTSLKVTDAPGAAASGSDEFPSKNDKMYIVHTSTLSTGTSATEDVSAPQPILAKFKQRNTVIRQCIETAVSHGPSPSETMLPTVKSPT